MASMSGTFDIDDWDESTFAGTEGSTRLTAATVAKSYHGDLEGTAKLTYLMTYRPDGTASFMGHELVETAVDGKKGSFALKHDGEFAEGAAKGSLEVIDGSGTGELEGITGSGSYEASPKGSWTLDLMV